MAGAGMNDIKLRIKSVNGTMQITKAMELVATSKLRRAKQAAESSRPFLSLLLEGIGDILSSGEAKSSPWLQESRGVPLIIVIAGDRGLAGGYNANVFRLAEQLRPGGEAVYLPIGKRALDYYRHRDRAILTDEFEYVSEVSVGDTFAISELVCRGFTEGRFSSATLVYTEFVSMLTQTPTYKQLLPLCCVDGASNATDPIWGGEPDEILADVVPQYVGGVVHSAVCESLASESGARRTAMNAANKNAEEMIGALMLRYNRARQAIITQEITEIVSGAEAL